MSLNETYPDTNSKTTVPEWVPTQHRNELPNVLDWNNEADCPPINCRVDVINEERGTGTVRAYFHAHGKLGVFVALDSVPNSMKNVLPPGSPYVHLWGENIIRLDQGDEDDPNEQDAGAADLSLAEIAYFKALTAAK